jgi:hypothetical protein
MDLRAVSNQHRPHLWRIDCQHQQAQTDGPNRQLSIISPRPGLGANIIPCATIQHCKHVIFPYPFMSGFQRLSLICVTALEKREKCFPSRLPDAHYIDISANKTEEKGRNMYTQMYTGGQFWYLLPYSRFFKTHDTRKANTQPPIVLL